MYSLNYDKLILDVNGIKVTCSIQFLREVPESVTERTTDIKGLVSLMLSVTGYNIMQSLKSSNTGEIK